MFQMDDMPDDKLINVILQWLLTNFTSIRSGNSYKQDSIRHTRRVITQHDNFITDTINFSSLKDKGLRSLMTLELIPSTIFVQING
jgi:hypothetical protein